MGFASFEERVMVNNDLLTDLEHKFAAYALANPAEASSQTVSKLAAKFYVSPNAIVRFAHKLGYDGFSDMRLALKRESTSNDGATDSKESAQDLDTLELVRRTTTACCNPKMEAKVAKLMHHASSVVFFALGETAYIAHAYARLFGEFDEKTQFITYEHQVKNEIARKDNVVVVFVSLSGKTPQVLSVARDVLDHGNKIVSITSLHPNPLARMATYSLYCYSPGRNIKGVNTTNLTPLCAALTSFQSVYLQEIGVELPTLDEQP